MSTSDERLFGTVPETIDSAQSRIDSMKNDKNDARKIFNNELLNGIKNELDKDYSKNENGDVAVIDIIDEGRLVFVRINCS